MTRSVTLDSFDHALLREMQRDNQTPARVLAERIGLSQSAVLRRLRRLRAEKVITPDVSVINPEVLGQSLTVHVLVSIARGSRTYGDFARKLRDRPEVRHASYVTGDADFIVHLEVESMAAYANFARAVFHDDPMVSEYHTYVEMREIVGPRTPR